MPHFPPNLPEKLASHLLRHFPREQLEALACRLTGQQPASPPLWKPFPDQQGHPHPQRLALESRADELFFGGSSGGGKTDLALGLAITRHYRTLFLRRQSVQLTSAVDRLKLLVGTAGKWRSSGHGGTMRIGDRVIDLDGCENEDAKNKFQGRPYSYYAFDEAPHFSRSQYQFIVGWNRTDRPDERCRVLLTGNPPTDPEGLWVVEEWAPWLDATYPDPAIPGELRWYTYLDGKLTWLKTGDPVTHKGEVIRPRSRTFIPSRVTDNPVYMSTGYMATLQARPEPLRSQMLYGDFTIGQQDDAWQVIPTAWVREAQSRWTAEGKGDTPLTCTGTDPARGGGDKTAISRRYGTWFAPVSRWPGKGTPDGPAVVGLLQQLLTEDGEAGALATHHIDVIGIGSSVYDFARQAGLRAVAFTASAGTSKRDRPRTLHFANLRAWSWWSLREALDPANPVKLALPPDPELLADLCSARWKHTVSGVQIEKKEEIVKRIGRSPDVGEALILASLPPRVDIRLEEF